MRWLILGIAFIIAAVAFKMLPRVEMMPSGQPGGVMQMDKWSGAIRLCTPDKCTPWLGGSGPATSFPPAA